MKIEVRSISDKYQEASVDEISTGTMDRNEAIDMASHLLEVANTLLTGAGMDCLGDKCIWIVEGIEQDNV